jgi:hypothetical protein
VKPSVALLVVLGTGCSFIGVNGPPSPLPARGTVPCDDSNGLPIVDTVMAGLAAALLVANASSGCGGDRFCDGISTIVVGVGAGIGVPYALSAVVGYDRVSRCKRANSPERRAQDVSAGSIQSSTWDLVNAATVAARRGDCATVASLERKVKEADGQVHDAVFVREPAIARCFAPTPSCFDETMDASSIHVCLPSRAACQTAIGVLPLGTVTTNCT